MWSIPCLAFWLLILNPVLLSLSTDVGNYVLNTFYDHIYPSLQLNKDNDWLVRTRVVIPTDSNNQISVYNIIISSLPQAWFTLPVVWAASLAIPYRKLRNLTITSVIFVVVALFLLLWSLMGKIDILLTEQLSYTIIDMNLKEIIYLAPSTSLKYFFISFYGNSKYFLIILLPNILIYLLTKPYWQTGNTEDVKNSCNKGG